MEALSRPGAYVFTTASSVPAGVRPVMTFTEDEGLTLIVDRPTADAYALPYDLVFAWITIQLYSALDGVGLTAAISTALADADISCNMVAALNHDHVFVPVEDADRAAALIRGL
jgi:uncharacterized protein